MDRRDTQPVAPADYFTCTLSQAIEINLKKGARITGGSEGVIISHGEYATINEFIDFLAKQHGSRLAIGCVSPSRADKAESVAARDEVLSSWATHFDLQGIPLTPLYAGFEELRSLSTQAGRQLRDQLSGSQRPGAWVALLAHSSLVFLITWLGLIRVGLKVLLVAPQSSPETIHHLLESCEAKTIIHDFQHRQLAKKATEESQITSSLLDGTTSTSEARFRCIQLDWSSLDELRSAVNNNNAFENEPFDVHDRRATALTHSFHSSGTTGRPKLIPQTNHGSVGVLPLLQDSFTRSAIRSTFTTTPLYHGGVQDALRSWSAAAPLWIFPEGRLPITGSSVLACIRRIDELALTDAFPATVLSYLSCVPFVLESMIESPLMINRLRAMYMVGVGGAAMPTQLGNRLVAEGVALVSRFGSSECGFLMSSHREFESDHRWSQLRNDSSRLAFRPMAESDRCELVVSKDWPFVSTAQHAQRPFDTHDIFVAVEDDIWEYKGRSDAVITLKTGKKLDPEHIEDLLRGSECIKEALIIGEGQHAPGGLIFAANRRDTIEEGLMWHAIQNVNRKLPEYTRLSKQNIVFLSTEEIDRIRRNNKGGIIRSSVVSDFKEEVTKVYQASTQAATTSDISYWKIIDAVKTAVEEQISHDIGFGDDFFEAGLNSAGCVNLCRQLSRDLGATYLRLGTVYECGSVSELAKYIAEKSSIGWEPSKDDDQKIEEMSSMVDHYAKMHPTLFGRAKRMVDETHQVRPETVSSKVVALTGASGFLGVHLLSLLLRDQQVSKVFVLMRGSRLVSHTEQVSRMCARVKAALDYHRLTCDTFKAVFVPYIIKEEGLGIDPTIYNTMTKQITHIIHAAWEVNFNLALKSFGNHVRGAIELFTLAILAGRQRKCTIQFAFISSIASVSNRTGMQDSLSIDPADAAQLGYAQSKWVTEAVLARLNRAHANVAVSIMRIGQLSGDTQHGIWNTREAWPLMFHASMNAIPHDKATYILPDLANTVVPAVDWLPIDCAAKSILCVLDDTPARPIIVQEVSNSRNSVAWSCMQLWIAQWLESQNMKLITLSAKAWLDRLDEDGVQHQAKALIPLWRKNWCSSLDKQGLNDITEASDLIYRSSREAPTSMSSRHMITRSYIIKLLTWIKKDS